MVFLGHVWLVKHKDNILANFSTRHHERIVIDDQTKPLLSVIIPCTTENKPKTELPSTLHSESPNKQFSLTIDLNCNLLLHFDKQKTTIGSLANDAFCSNFTFQIYWSRCSRFAVIQMATVVKERIVTLTDIDNTETGVKQHPYVKPGDPLSKTTFFLFSTVPNNRLTTFETTLYNNPFIIDRCELHENNRFTFRYVERGHQVK